MREFPPRPWVVGFCLFMGGTGVGMLIADGFGWERMLLLTWLVLALMTWRRWGG